MRLDNYRRNDNVVDYLPLQVCQEAISIAIFFPENDISSMYQKRLVSNFAHPSCMAIPIIGGDRYWLRRSGQPGIRLKRLPRYEA